MTRRLVPRAGALPVSLISGLPGEWKSNLVRHVVANAHPADLRITILLIGLDKLDIASDLIKERTKIAITLQNGYICQQLSADVPLPSVLLEIAKDRNVDRCIVLYDLPDSVTHIAEDISDEEALTVDTSTIVIDANRFHCDLTAGGKAMSRWKELEPDVATRDVAEVFAEKIESADMIFVVNGAAAGEMRMRRVANAVRAFNVTAPVKCLQHVHVDVTDIVCTKRYSEDSVSNCKRWLHEIRESDAAECGKSDETTGKDEDVTAESLAQHRKDESKLSGDDEKNRTESEGKVEQRNEVVSLVYKRRRPFHPVRFARTAVVQMQGAARPLRSKGFLWLASRYNVYGEWSQAGSAWTLQPGGTWLCSTPRERWPSQDPSFVEQVEADFAPEVGDRRQEIAFMGIESEFDRDSLAKKLDACLLTDDEWSKGHEAWEEFEDPFPKWIPVSDDEEEEVVSDDSSVTDESQDEKTERSADFEPSCTDNESRKDEVVDKQPCLDDVSIKSANSKRKLSLTSGTDPSKRTKSA